jgi:hypothetical protein
MESEHKAYSIVSVSLAAVLITLSITGKCCNDSDNAVLKVGIEKGCQAIPGPNGNPTLLCK